MRVSASSLARTMSCAGWMLIQPEVPYQSSPQAEEGTAAGEYLEHVLSGVPEDITHASNGVYIDSDMQYYAELTAKNITSRAASAISCEAPLNWTSACGMEVKGRSDVLYFDEDGALCIDDYKYGHRLVEAEGNWQLISYAIGFVMNSGQPVENIKLRILQPRPHHEDGIFREWTITYNELLEYKTRIDDRLTSLNNGNNELQTGTHCRYCPAAMQCAAANKNFFRAMEETHSFTPDNITDEELSYQMELIERIHDIVKQRKDSVEQLITHRLNEGRMINNYEVKEKYGHRKWIASADAETLKMLTGKDVEVKSIMSPAKLMKAGIPKEIIDSLTEKPFLGKQIKRVDTSKLGDRIFGNPNR